MEEAGVDLGGGDHIFICIRLHTLIMFKGI